MHPYRLSRVFVALSLSAAATSALASPQAFMSSRSFAMAGTGVAIAHPSSATFTNPAMMAADHHAWADDFGLTLPSINARLADEEETIDQIDDIQDAIDHFGSQKYSSPEQAQATAKDLLQRLEALDGDTMRANVGLGLSVAVPSKVVAMGFFARGNLTATARGELDDDDRKTLQKLINLNPQSPGAGEELRNTNLDNLESRGTILASAVAEAGLSFAHSLDLNNGDSLQLGFAPKYVELRTFQYAESVSSFEDDEFDSDQYQTEKSGFNLDLGAAYAFGAEKQWNAGIAIKNLIPMKLDSKATGTDQHTLRLDPMATIGLAHKSNYHVITAEVDLTEKKAFGFEDDTQWLALGAEFDAWRYAQLRAGVRHNLASNSDNSGIEEKTQFTAGLGLNLMGVRFDLGALFSSADLGAALELGTSF